MFINVPGKLLNPLFHFSIVSLYHFFGMPTNNKNKYHSNIPVSGCPASFFWCFECEKEILSLNTFALFAGTMSTDKLYESEKKTAKID